MINFKKTQLAQKDFLIGYLVDKKCDRDCEVPNLIDYIKSRAPVKFLLDVGCAYSHLSYAKKIRDFIVGYHGVDVMPCPETEKIIDYYRVGNATDQIFYFEKYDLVICVSVIEHAGLSTYSAFFRRERYRLFERLLDLAQKGIWISFPVGLEYIVCNEQGHPDFCPITREDLEYFEGLAEEKGWKFKERFFYNQGPQAGFNWYEHQDRDLALKIPYIDFVGNQSNCIMELSKIERKEKCIN